MRARNIKPGFFQDDRIASTQPEARLLFVGLLMLADDRGDIEDRPRRIKVQIFPYDAVDIEPLLDELVVAGLVCRGAGVIHIPRPYDWVEPIRLPASVWNQLRKIVFDRDGRTCQYCGAVDVPLHCDHIIPLVKGGTNDLDNLTTACGPCNLSKSDKTLKEWRG